MMGVFSPSPWNNSSIFFVLATLAMSGLSAGKRYLPPGMLVGYGFKHHLPPVLVGILAIGRVHGSPRMRSCQPLWQTLSREMKASRMASHVLFIDVGRRLINGGQVQPTREKTHKRQSIGKGDELSLPTGQLDEVMLRAR